MERAGALASDRDSGASEITARLLLLLADAVRAGADAPLDVARIVLSGQPVMAPLWHACAAAVAERERPGTFERTRQEMIRAPHALTRAASFALRDLFTGECSPLVLTISYSHSVARALVALAPFARLRAVCAEGRPRFEGRRLASTLADHGVEATLVVDAALTTCLPDASAVVMGADAVTADAWFNKVGSAGVSAAAALRGVPVYVIASRDKFVPRALAARLASTGASPDEVWPDAPPGVRCHNPYFEAVPMQLCTLVLTEVGPVPPLDVGRAADRHAREIEHLSSLLG